MKAFVNCKVSKDEVLGSLEAHQVADHFIRGQYWEDGKGCSMGCTIHDFAPGEEKNHSLYPELFGLPVSFAYLQDSIFEGLPLEDSKKWSVKVISAIPIGCDVGRKIDEFLYWILSGGDSPISKYRNNKEIKAVAELYRQKLKGEKIKREEWVKAAKNAKARVYATVADDANISDADAANIAYAYAIYIATDADAANFAYAYAVYAATAADATAAYANVAYAVYVANATATYGVATKKMADKLIKILKGD